MCVCVCVCVCKCAYACAHTGVRLHACMCVHVCACIVIIHVLCCHASMDLLHVHYLGPCLFALPQPGHVPLVFRPLSPLLRVNGSPVDRCLALAALLLGLQPALADHVPVQSPGDAHEAGSKDGHQADQLPVHHLLHLHDVHRLVEEGAAVPLAFGVRVEGCQRHDEVTGRSAGVGGELVVDGHLLPGTDDLAERRHREVLDVQAEVGGGVEGPGDERDVVRLAPLVVEAHHHVHHPARRELLVSVGGQQVGCLH